jgi:DNA modification methylase
VKIRDRIRELRRVPASELRPNPKNWRTHPQAQADALRGVLAEVGIADAVLARELEDGSLMLLDGHLRVETMGDQVLPVLVLDVNEAEGDKVLATLDPLAAMAESDAAKLDAILREVDTGSPELQQMLSDLAEEAGLYQDENKEIVEDEIPQPPVDPITKPGDLWTLGDHRLLCGDSTKAEDVERLMAGAKADLCFTSPPYGQQRDYTEEGKAKVADWDGLMLGVFGNLPMADSGQVLVNLGLIHRDGEWIPYWDLWIEWMRDQGWRRFGWYVWDQGSGLPGDWNGRLGPSHEFVFHFNKDGVRPDKWFECDPSNVAIGKRATEKRKAGKDVTSMRDKDGTVKPVSSTERNSHKIPDSVIRISRCATIDMARQNHPATFPIQLPAFAIRSWPGTVYEPFCGSGTTLIAAEQLGRKCYGMEISPQYCDVIVKRWEALTGKKAVLDKPAKKPK